MGLKANTILALPCIINVGLSSDTDARLSKDYRTRLEAKRLAKWYETCLTAGASRIGLQHSATEPTLIAYFQQHYRRMWLGQLAATTNQNCIAVYYQTIRQGCLIGSNCEAIGGEFLRDFFVLFDGSRLGNNLSM